MVATISLLSGSLLGASWNRRQRRTLTVSICLPHLISWLSFSLWYGLCTSLPLVACLGSVSSFFLLVLSLALPLPSQHITCCDCNCFRGCLCLLVQLICWSCSSRNDLRGEDQRDSEQEAHRDGRSQVMSPCMSSAGRSFSHNSARTTGLRATAWTGPVPPHVVNMQEQNNYKEKFWSSGW
jgi:hypothetical protein